MKPNKYERVNQLIKLIYGAVNQPDAWNTISQEIEKTFDVPQGMFLLRDKMDLRPVDWFLWGEINQSFARYTEHFHQKDIWTNALIQNQHGNFHASQNLVTDRVFLKSELYSDFAIPIDVRHGSGVILHIPNHELIGQFVCLRENGQPYFDRHTLSELNLLTPHLTQFISLRQTINNLKLQSCTMESLVDSLNAAAFVCEGDGLIVYKNKLADALSMNNEWLTDKNRYLGLMHSDEKRILQQLIKDACCTADGNFSQAGGNIERQSFSKKTTIQIFPLPHSPSKFLFDTPAPCCLVFITDTDHLKLPTTFELQQIYTLTPAEAEITSLLALACSANEIADKRGARIATVRTQIRSVYTKLEVNSQIELLRKLLF